jgi:hypothetical protein
LKWLELEKAIARAMTNEVPGKTTLGERWCFFRDSLLKGRQAKLALMPQVVPRVKRNGKELDKTEVEQWSEGTRESPPPPTMRQSDWPGLFPYLDLHRTVLPVDKSRSPDCMFVFEEALLCFQAKSGSQDLSLKHLKKEVAKSPFLGLDNEVLSLLI